MPELADVEGFRRVLAEHAVGRRIKRVEVFDPGVLRGVSAPRLGERLRGRRFRPPRRHGKWLIVPVSDGHGDEPTVLLHFGMTGSLRWAAEGDDRHRHDRVAFVFAEGELRYRDMRKLQGLRLASGREVDRTLADLGPDAVGLSRVGLADVLRGRRGKVKATLVDQSVIAGLGNLLADEILWRAGVNPCRPCVHLGAPEIGRLHARMRSVLRQSIRDGRVPPRKSWLTGRRDEPSGSCPRCGTTLRRGRVGGRGTVWCPSCQPD
jgi:formamidopyrimidine-DNA glycosylase